MRTRYGVSPWIHQFPDSRRLDLAACRGELRAPVVIVGAGLTGCATAYVFAAAGVPSIVLEAERVGHGASGHSAGLLLPDPGPSFLAIEQRYGRRAARFFFQSWRRAGLDGSSTLRRLRIPCGLEPCDTVDVAIDQPEEKRLARELAVRADAGLDAVTLRRPQLAKDTALDGWLGAKMHDAFGLDPYRACVGLARAARARGAKLFERSPVARVRFTERQVDVHTAHAHVTADTVIVTTGLATEEFRQLRRHFRIRESYLVLTEPLRAGMAPRLGNRAATLRDVRAPHRRVRFVGDRILVGGAEQPPAPARSRDAVLVQRTGQLMYELLTWYPAIHGLQPEYGWSVRTGDTADGLPYIGPHRNLPRHLFALGAGGDSVTGAFLAARLLLRRYQDAAEKQDSLWAFTRS